MQHQSALTKAEVLHGEANGIWTTCNRSDDYVANHQYKPKLPAHTAPAEFKLRSGAVTQTIYCSCVGVDRGLLVGVETITPDSRKRFLGKRLVV